MKDNQPSPLSISKFVSYVNSSIDTAISSYGMEGGAPPEMLAAANLFRDQLVLEHARWLKANINYETK